jgi:hypothetical protein
MVLAFFPATSLCETYVIDGWVDANKTWDDDSSMCWAAAASNILAWGRWDVAPYFTGSEVFANFKTTWPNIGGQTLWGYAWWLNGVVPGVPLMVPGGNYWPGYSYTSKYNIDSGNVSSIDRFLHSGSGVTLGIENSVGATHALTCWGYNYNPANPQYLPSSTSPILMMVSWPCRRIV